MARTVEERFDAKWEVDESGCWLWTASTDNAGYGCFGVKDERSACWRTVRAHRLAYETAVGPIPDGLVLDHLCRVRNCVNPDHLEPVTSGENVLRGDTITARCAATTHCPQGHPYDEKNTYHNPAGFRACRTCLAERDRRRNRRTVASCG